MDYIPQACSRSNTGHPKPKYRHRPEHQPTEVSPIFSIETYEIYADVRIQLLVCLQLAGNLQHDGYPLAPSLAPITGLRQLVLSGSLSAQGRLSQWAQSKMRFSAFGL